MTYPPSLRLYSLCPAFLFLLMIVPVACNSQQDKKKASVFLQTYGGDPYMGTVQVDIIRPDGSIKTAGYGEATANFVDSGQGKAQMVVFGAIKDKKGDAGFAATGTHQAKTWKIRSDSLSLEIRQDGTINGNGASYPQQFQFTGSISDRRLELVTRVRSLQPAGGLPGGTTYVFRYNLRRDINSPPTTKRKCDRIEWQTRYVAGFDGGATTVRVPVCMSNK